MSETPDIMTRLSVPAIDRILGIPVPILKHGFIRVVDYLGSDAAIVQAARVSYGIGTKAVNEDRGLIRYLMRHRHTTPFEMCELKLHVKVPMDHWRQWIRHRTASVNEYSTRYSIAIDDMETTRPSEWRLQSTDNKQGSAGFATGDEADALSDHELDFQRYAREVYAARLAAGVAREQARKDLPLSTYTEAYWKIDLHNLLHFLSLRMDPHAQLEIRAYANAIGDIVAQWVPLTWEAFQDYRLGGMQFSRIEVELLEAMLHGPGMLYPSPVAVAERFGFLGPGGAVTKSREREEFENKLKILGVRAPWLP